MSKIYVVYSTTGEYSDRSEWAVAAYCDESLARDHAEAAKKWYEERGGVRIRDRENHWEWLEKNPNPFDPFMHIDYTGADWTIGEVELRDALPISQAVREVPA